MNRKILIEEIAPGKIPGVEVEVFQPQNTGHDTYFEWTPCSLIAEMGSSQISGGFLEAWHHAPVFQQVESHIHPEMFYFFSGTAIMLFADVKDGAVDPNSIQIVRIPNRTQIIISAGKAHFVAVAEGNEPVGIVVVSPKMEAPRLDLPFTVEGVTE